MATVKFEVKSYNIEIAREMNATFGGKTINIRGVIACRGDQGYECLIYALAKDSPLPDNAFDSARGRGFVFIEENVFPWYVDLLRNEKPVFCRLSSTNPNWNSVSTSAEPVGEGQES